MGNPATIRADRLLIYQALTNLVTNAIKYSPSGTTVSIGLGNGGGSVRFQIADQGFGIPACVDVKHGWREDFANRDRQRAQ